MYNSIDKELLDEVCNGYLIGVLASEEDDLPSIGYDKSPVSILKNSDITSPGNVVNYFKLLCAEPAEFNEINKLIPYPDIYVNLDYHNFGINLYRPDYINLDCDDKIDVNENIFHNKIVIFKPKITIKNDKLYKNMSIVKIIDAVDLNSKYESIPIVNHSIDDFELKLYKSEKLSIDDGVKACCSDDHVLCENRLYGVFESWYKAFGTPNSWMCEYEEDITYIDINLNSSEAKENIFIINNEVAFINLHYFRKLDNKLMSEGHVIDLKRFSDEYYSDKKNKQTNSSVKLEEVSVDILESTTSNNFKYRKDSSELEFLNKFEDLVNEKGLSYKFEDLVNFHISLKTSPLTIVAGMTGTGKTQIAKSYADLLGLNHYNGKLLFLPISPSYTEPEDVLGYLNTNTGLYTPSETGLIDLLIRAKNDTNGIYMVIFDEMNLSQIEHWFAPFLSLLELPVEDRKLHLYSEGQICHNSYKYPCEIKIPENVLFVGTVNLDETTKDFSDRVLDRANVISLSKKKFLEVYTEETSKGFSVKDNSNFETINFSTYSNWIQKSKGIKGFNKHEVLFLDELDQLLTSEDSQKGISYRMINKISSYLENIPMNISGKLLIDRRVAFDFVLLQRLLPKLRGTERQLDGILCSINNTFSDSPLYDIFNSVNAKEVSDFDKVKSKIKEKEKDLDKYGYAN